MFVIFQSSYFYKVDLQETQKQKKLANKLKMERSFTLKNEKIKELNKKHKETLQKIADSLKSLDRRMEIRDKELKEKQLERSSKAEFFNDNKKDLNYQNENKLKSVLKKQINSFNNCEFINQSNELYSMALK